MTLRSRVRTRLRRFFARSEEPDNPPVVFARSEEMDNPPVESLVAIDSLDDLEAYRLNLRPILQLLEDSAIEYFVVSAPRGLSRPVIGLPPPSLSVFRSLLRDSGVDLPSLAQISGDGLDRTVIATSDLADLDIELSDVTNLRVVLYTPMTNPATGREFDNAHGCVLEVWREDNGSLSAPDARQAVQIAVKARTESVPIDVLGMTGTTYAPLATSDILEVEFPIDIVFLWVDGADPQWRAKIEAAAEASGAPESGILARFRQFDELRYSLRSIARYAPWVNRVFLVTDSQRPAWLEESGTNLTVVDHREILPASALPTFNSHSLTASLHRIPGLSEMFILFNDDILLGRPTRPERFINSNGTTRFFLSGRLVSTQPNVAHEHARLHTCDVIEKAIGSRPMRLFKHTPNAMSKSLLGELEREFASEWERTVHNTFRSATDIVPSYIHHYVGYHKRRTQPATISYEYFELGGDSFGDALASYQRGGPAEVLCINDVGASSTGDNPNQLDHFFQTQYPYRSPYELNS